MSCYIRNHPLVVFAVLAFWLSSEFVLRGDESNAPPSFKYEWVENWPDLPDDFVLGNPTGLDVDSEGCIWVFHRGNRRWANPMPQSKIKENTITKLDGEKGQVLDSWGGNLFVMPHGLTVDAKDHIWVTDVGLHQVFKFEADGTLLLAIGEPGVAGLDKGHFGLPTDVAVASDGSFYVADGYGNSRVVKFSAEGQYLLEWGAIGRGPDQFVIPHGIDLDKDENVYVADRENNRIKKFDGKGGLLSIWKNKEADQLYSITIHPELPQLFGIDYDLDKDGRILGSDIVRFDLDLNIQDRFGRSTSYVGPVSRYHDIAVDKEGNLYVGDILGNTVQKFRLH